ncbi:Peritrophin-1 [Pseudolycoriella hygida]|uniref:Peritrophin-1 n=1 Tax=Pseudolycoriella hygida TaxID=35572 RepID=A0A9Q0NBV4_9DIPT|nr:Peritrophin-1 [Pseudolycoriella hygida]
MKLLIGIALTLLSTVYANEIDICHGVPVNTFIRDVSACNAWFRCTANGPVPGTCPSPWLFNPTTQECDWEQNVQCFTCPITVPIVNIAVNGSCVGFIRCINGRASQHACQNGLLFNSATGQCDLPENVDCRIEFTCPPNIPPGQMVAFRSDTNCSEFYVCTGPGNPIQQSCNPALHFDPVTQQCTFPNMTDCPLTPPGDGTTTPNPGGPTTTTQAPFVCQSDGHFPHPTTCSSFVVCAGGTPHFFNCSEGLHFNASTRQCDLPSNANCTLK